MTKEKTSREKAIEWWSKLSFTTKESLMEVQFSDRHLQSLTGREVESLYDTFTKHNFTA